MIAPHRWMQHERCPHCGAREYGECLRPAQCVLDDPELQAKYDRLEAAVAAGAASITALQASIERHAQREKRLDRLENIALAIVALVVAIAFACSVFL